MSRRFQPFLLTRLLRGGRLSKPGRTFRPLPLDKDDLAIVAAIRGEFDCELYYAENPDVAWQGVDPVMHYVKHRAKEGRRPNRDFDPAFYEARYGGSPPGMEAFHHFLGERKRLGHLPKAREDFRRSDSLDLPERGHAFATPEEQG